MAKRYRILEPTRRAALYDARNIELHNAIQDLQGARRDLQYRQTLLRMARERGNQEEISSEADIVRQVRGRVREKIRNARALMNGAGARGKSTGSMGH